ncbi:MAG TPA: VWA domain-containing protein [Pyrinomonadaceae bacterium]|nr:VWA domain-containing protein [Pyrinomonadaceae bacterium]
MSKTRLRPYLSLHLRMQAFFLLLPAFFCGVMLVQTSFSQTPTPTPAATPEGSQQKPSPTPPDQERDLDVVKITTNLVQIDAVVLDKSGKRITDLRPEEVEMVEDGKVQKISHFSYISLESRTATPVNPKSTDKSAPPVPPVKLKPEQVRRTIALVVDDLGLSFESAYFVRNALKKFIDQQMQSDDLVAIIRTGGGIGALQQFTSDKRQLYAAIEKVKWNPIGTGHVSAFAPISADPTTRADSSGNPNGSGSEDIDEFRQDIFAVGTLGAINYVVKGLGELPGRKSVVLFSDGLRLFDRSDPFLNTRILSALRHLTDLANRASVVIYTMDARGLQTLGLTAADDTAGMSADQVEQSLSDRRNQFFDSQDGLAYLSDQTGGIAFRNNNDLNAGLKKVMDDQQGYYLIGFRPDESTFDKVNGRTKFHKISLRIKRPGKFSVRMRNGFFGISDEAATVAKQTPQQQLVGALISPFGSSGIQLRLTSLFANDAKLGSVMRSLLSINGKDLTFTVEPDGTHKSVFDILAVTFGDNGTIVEQFGRRHTITLKDKAYERVLSGGLVYNMMVPIKKPGAYQLRTALRDEASERVGSATQFIEVPDIKKNRLAISGILMKGMPLDQYLKTAGLAAPSQGSDDTAEEGDPHANSAVRQFRSGFALIYAFSVYNAQLDKATGKPQLKVQARVFRNGQTVFSGQEVPFDLNDQPDLKRLLGGGAIQLGTEMLPGEYVFQIVVTDLLANEKRRVITQWTDFEIVK